MKKITLLFLLLGSLCIQKSYSQELMNMLKDDENTAKDYTTAAFKTTRLVIGQSIENVAKGNLNFIISHHFGSINEGKSEFFGLDQSTIRLGLEYGILDILEVGIGRSTYQKTADGYLKLKLLRQQKSKIPISVSYFGNTTLNTLKWEDPNRDNYFTSRLSFVSQMLIARKFNNNLSLQIIATHVHKNLVKKIVDQNDCFAVGGGGRYKFSNRMSVNTEYHYVLPGQTADDFSNSLSFGVDMETGGHVFQLFFTNSHPLFERGFITETTGKWNKGDIYFGFNIIRTFTVVRPKNFRN
ncbi:MAG: hypothetical protein HGB12_02680 [Bacteroidetes bacterium]|nr:hypothetical protein [Bacteroidota bacterium]